MNKKLTVLILIVMLVSCFAALIACNHVCSFGEWETVTDPTCTEQGLKVRYCTDSGCNKKEEQNIPADPTKHNLQSVAHTDATCTTDGTIAHNHCTLCGKNYDAEGNELQTVVIAKEHKFEAEWKVVKESTCTEEGLREKHCTNANCNEVLSESIPIDPAKHNLQPVEKVDSTCTAEGIAAHNHCTLCKKNFDGDNKELTDITIPVNSANHNLQHVGKEDATCTEDGIAEHDHCTLCSKNFDNKGNELTSVVIKKGHKLETIEAVLYDHTEGMRAYRSCTVCNKNFDLTEETEVDLKDLVVPAQHGDYSKDTLYCITCDKYVIIDAEQFAWFRNNVNSADKYNGKTVVLDADIDLNNEEWTPIDGFLGEFDGQGHTIRNLKINGQNNVGLFGDMSNSRSVIHDFTIDGATVNGAESVGVVMGSARSVEISDITVKNAKITSNHWAGGIIGYSYPALINNCSVDGLEIICIPNAVTGGYDNGDKVGGIVGYIAAKSVTNCTVTNAVLKGYRDIGGIAGTLQCADGSSASATGNSVSNITIKVDQATNHYGSKEMNANAVIGRVLNDGSNIAVLENNTEENIRYEFTVNAASAQMALDSFKDNSVIKLVADTYGKLLIRQSKYVSVKTSADSYPRYLREFTSVTILGESGVVVNGLELIVGHQHSPGGNNTVYDPVTGKYNDYYSKFVIKNLAFSGIKFTDCCDFSGWYSSLLLCDGLSFKNCEFDMADSAVSSQSGTNPAIKFGSGEDDRIWLNLVFEQCVFKNAFQGIYTTNVEGIGIKNCKFENITHNAIAIQSTSANGNVGTAGGNIVIENNEFTNGTNRAIRFGDVGADAAITVKNNAFSNFCDGDGEILKTVNTAVGATIAFENNSYDGNLLSDRYIECNGDVVAITNK